MGKKDWFFSAKVFTSLILIIFPISYTSFSLPIAVKVSLSSENEHLLNPILYPIVIPHQPSYPVVFPPIPLFIVLLGFSIYPSIYPTRKFFIKRGFENVVVEYYYIKKILFFSIILLITFLSLFLISITIESTINKMLGNDPTKNLQQEIETLENIDKKLWKELDTLKRNDTSFNTTYEFRSLIQKLNSIYSNDTISNTSPMIQKLNSIIPFTDVTTSLYYSIFFILTIPLSIIIKLIIEHSRKLFKLYLATGCFEIVLKKSSDEIDKAKYFMRGLIWYNRFLKNNINLQINNIDKVCENMLIKSPLDNNDILLAIAKSFEEIKENEKEDEKGLNVFRPLRLITIILPNAEGEKILTKESLRTKIQESSDLLIPIITIIITIITTFFFKSLS